MKAMLRWAAGILVFISTGHLLLELIFGFDHIAGWADRGFWAAVPLLEGSKATATVDSLNNVLAYWAGPGSFGVPTILLGCLIWSLVGRGVPVPEWLGWAIIGWTLIGGILLVPSPTFVKTIAGVLIILAARRRRAEATTATGQDVASPTPC